jgi:hypothetical protein
MQELRFAETSARGLTAKSIPNGDEAVLYAQWALEAAKAQRLHANHCDECNGKNGARRVVGGVGERF